MNRLIIPVLLAASIFQLPTRLAAAQPTKKGAPVASGGTSAPSGDQGPVVVLSALKPGDPIRVKSRNAWVDGKVIEVSGSSVGVQLGGNREYFEAEKVWGTQEARDNEAAGGYLDPTTRANFELFKVAVDKLEAAKRSGADADALEAARDDAEQILKADYGKAGQHPRVGPILARYWAVATAKCDAIAAQAVAEAQQAATTPGSSYFSGFTYSTWSRAEQVLTEYKEFQTTANAETARLEKVLAEARATIDEARAAFALAELAQARVPKEIYKGADKKALKAKITAAWKKQFPNRPILKLVASTDWSHERSWRTNYSAAGGYWYDWTTLYMDLVVKKDGTLATVYPVAVSYQDGNKKKLVVNAGDGGAGNYVPFDMLLKNVK